MRILFISSAGKGNQISSIIENQGRSVINNGVSVEFFGILHGMIQYITAIYRLKKKLKEKTYDVLHALWLVWCCGTNCQ